MKLEDIGFYTLSEERAKTTSVTSPMQRCELIVTGRCNFACPYCRPLLDGCDDDMELGFALQVLKTWTDEGLQNVRFSGGEPTLWEHLVTCVKYCRARGVKRVAISTNGSQPIETYQRLLDAGVNDFSISLDSCCSSTVDQLTGTTGQLAHIIRVIRFLSAQTYVTLGVVLTEANAGGVNTIIAMAPELGVADIRVIPAAQCRPDLVEEDGLRQGDWPILSYRAENISRGLPVRGLKTTDNPRCRLVLDDSVVAGRWHFPCVIYMREHGNPIGLALDPDMRHDRLWWSEETNVLEDPICKKNCLDVCRQYNNQAAKYAEESEAEHE